jgi:hypothetical protein
MKKTINSTAIGLLFVLSLATFGEAAMKERLPSATLQNAPESSMEQISQVEGRGYWKTVYNLVKLNIKIYGRLGWEIGRWEALRKYNIDIGSYPGAKKVTEQWFKQHFNK